MKATFVLAAVLLLPAAAAPQATAPRPAWDWPLAPRPAVMRAFDPPDKPWMSGHRGVDLKATHDGVPVTSPASGTVSFVGVVVDRPVITIDHGGGLRSSFEPVESRLTAGTVVAQGEIIGTLQAGHCGALACVHWGVRRADDYVNPLEFVTDLLPSILLPVRKADPVTSAEPAGRADPDSRAEPVALDDG
ncbi:MULTISPECIES: M23 family metallopeptidase [unclassified Arthrobacter]|uniref:M23 family metallopeptidase n=1 Tax=unclassified Arthrobacter TaxID=235627 RepID=UPI003398CAE8